MNDEPDPNAEMFRRLDALPWRKAPPAPNAGLPATAKGRIMFQNSDELFYVVMANGNIRGHFVFATPDRSEALFAASVAGLCDEPGGLSVERREAIRREVMAKLPAGH